jgi:hypothetical protein
MDLVTLAVELDPARCGSRLVVAHQLRHDPELLAQMGPLLDVGRHRRLEEPVEGDGLALVPVQPEADRTQRLHDLVVDRSDRGVDGVTGQAATRPHGELLLAA